MEVFKFKKCSKIKNSINRFNRILDTAEEKVSELENIPIEIIQTNDQRGREKYGTYSKNQHVTIVSEEKEN